MAAAADNQQVALQSLHRIDNRISGVAPAALQCNRTNAHALRAALRPCQNTPSAAVCMVLLRSPALPAKFLSSAPVTSPPIVSKIRWALVAFAKAAPASMARSAAAEPSVATMMQRIKSVLRGMGAKKGRVVSHRQVALFTVADRMQGEYTLFGPRYCR